MKTPLLNPRLFLVAFLLLFFNAAKAVSPAAAPGDSTFNCSISLSADTGIAPLLINAIAEEDTISPIVSRTWTLTTCISDTPLVPHDSDVSVIFSFISPGCYCVILQSVNQLGQTCTAQKCNIAVKPEVPCYVSVNDSVNIACGNSYTFGGVAYYEPVVQTDTFINAYGCDTAFTLYLNVTTDTVYITQFICPGDSLLFYGLWLHYPVVNYDTLINTPGSCDSLLILNTPIIDPLPPHYIYDTICSNDSLLFNGVYLDTAGIYYAHYHVPPQRGCDSAVILTLAVRPAPEVTFTWDSLVKYISIFPNSVYGDTIVWCVDGGPCCVKLIGGNPPGGYYSGLGISNDTFSLDVAYQYIADTSQYHFPLAVVTSISYNYKGINSCLQSAMGNVLLAACEGISEIPNQYSLNLYPNPAQNYLTLEYTGVTNNSQIEIVDVLGHVIKTQQVNNPVANMQVDIHTLNNGLYFLRIVNDAGVVSQGKFSVIR